MKKVYLDGEWILYARDGQTWKASVPGCVHSDILADFQELYYRDNNESAKWIENEDWIYEKNFHVEETIGAYIVFEGLDTYCDIEINGTRIAECNNMFIEHSFYIEPYLKKGTNNIKVKFYSPVKWVEGREELPAAFTKERVHTRRMQCTYGWDWVERFVTCGIFRSVYIVYKNNMHCESAYIYTNQIDQYGANMCLRAFFENYTTGGLTHFEILSPDKKVVYQKSAYIDIEQYGFAFNIEDPILWDVSNDNNSMYVLRITIGEELFEQSFGIRTVRILEKEDAENTDAYNLCKKLQDTTSGKEYDRNDKFSSFEVILNGRRIMCKGGNWVPCEPFPSESTKEKITEILTTAKWAGMNVIRVWGGGLFECQHFYDECDRLGLFVIQDFLMACAQYPDHEDWFMEQLQMEVEYAAKKLRNHPSLIWWNGDNENAILGSETEDNYQGRKASVHGVFRNIAKYDFVRPCFISSPFGGFPNGSKTVGITHNTQFLGLLFDYIEDGDIGNNHLEYMKEYTARFNAEEPTFGAASYESLSQFMTDKDIYEEEDMWFYHTKNNPCLKNEIYNYTKKFAQKLFGEFQSGEDKLFKYQYLQYEWVRVTMENARRNRGFCNGIIYWMLNDCWPAAAGWSLIDYYCRPKAALYAFRNYADKVILSLDMEDDKLWLYLCNDGNESVTLDIDVKEIDVCSGQIIRSCSLNMECESNESARTELQSIQLNPNTIVVAETTNKRAFYKAGAFKIEPCKPPQILSCENGILRLKSECYVHAVELSGGYIYEDNFFTMLPNEVKEISYRGEATDIQIKAYSFK